ncbi:hypothetical protein [Streptomyces sp. bgisy153]|uniref:hypothetical protein n=1 Tax=Streptomyces sp. bgisy153 TaxID=3413793 RepID=UPI003D720D47
MPSSDAETQPAPTEHVTTDHLRAMCEILGLPPECVRTITSDASEGVTVTVLVRDRTGHIVARGDDVLTATIHIPLGS